MDPLLLSILHRYMQFKNDNNWAALMLELNLELLGMTLKKRIGFCLKHSVPQQK